MSKQITTTVYTLAELIERGDAKAVEAARQWLREGSTDHDWWEYEYETWKSALSQIGFADAQISFSGFASQGDGASFTCRRVDVAKLAEFLAAPPAPKDCITGDPEDFRPWLVHKAGGVAASPEFRRLVPCVDYVDASVDRTTHHYSHENTCRFHAALYRRTAPKVDALAAEFEAAGEALRRDLSRAIYRDLEAGFEHLTSDECIDEFAAANEYTFTASGERFG